MVEWYTHMLEVHGSQGRAGSSPAEGTLLLGIFSSVSARGGQGLERGQ